MERSEQLEAELEVVRLEEALRAAKDGDGPTMEQKLELREARRTYREAVAGATAGEGDATVNPEAIDTTAEAN